LINLFNSKSIDNNEPCNNNQGTHSVRHTGHEAKKDHKTMYKSTEMGITLTWYSLGGAAQGLVKGRL